MMSTLVCTECSEVKVETSRSIVLPFVCGGCQRTAGANPTGELPDSLYHQEAEEMLQDETATTLATIEIISDLESQLQVARDLTVGQTELIGQLEQQIEILQKEATDLNYQINVRNEAGEEVCGELQELQEQADALAFYLGFHATKAALLERDNVLLKQALTVVSAITGLGIRITR